VFFREFHLPPFASRSRNRLTAAALELTWSFL
jgi:hypothetical protein